MTIKSVSNQYEITMKLVSNHYETSIKHVPNQYVVFTDWKLIYQLEIYIFLNCV